MSTRTTTAEPSAPVGTEAPRRLGDSIFAGLARSAGILIMVALAGVGIFLLVEGAPAITASGEAAYGNDSIVLFVWPLLFGTLLASVIALVLAVPLAVGVAWSSRTTRRGGSPSRSAT